MREEIRTRKGSPLHQIHRKSFSGLIFKTNYQREC